MIGRNFKWNMSTADDSRQISSIVEKENGKTFVGPEEMSGEFIITKPVVRGEEEGSGEGTDGLSRLLQQIRKKRENNQGAETTTLLELFRCKNIKINGKNDPLNVFGRNI